MRNFFITTMLVMMFAVLNTNLHASGSSKNSHFCRYAPDICKREACQNKCEILRDELACEKNSKVAVKKCEFMGNQYDSKANNYSKLWDEYNNSVHCRSKCTDEQIKKHLIVEGMELERLESDIDKCFSLYEKDAEACLEKETACYEKCETL